MPQQKGGTWLDIKKVMAIKKLYESGWTPKQIMDHSGLDKQTVWCAIKSKRKQK